MAVAAGSTKISVATTFPAFHVRDFRRCRGCAAKCMVEGEFAHLHARYVAAGVDPAGRGRPWQLWQGGGLGSMHLVLDRRDAELVVARGWGEYHVLVGKADGVPPGLVLIYAPRDDAEIDIAVRLLEASYLHVTRE